ncbi:hypothetical protein HGRIS_013201 [Hohenbuehelia grisea]|uniref:TFIIB-type domain-containing protein n=1 Tax=Hohenbuehelia grisea TaxID=104357 RepID=A0ABR3IUM9_9AGAR
MSSCAECGGQTVWDDDVGSAICTTCGSLADPTQSVLTSHDLANSHDGLRNISSLKGYRSGNTWSLQGQSKSARDERLAHASHAFIRALANSLAVPGLSPRSINLFTQAMAAGNFRWGRKANLVAGVCLAITLRESRRPDSLRDIAALIEEPPPLLTRLFSPVLALLNLKLAPADPVIYIPTLEANLTSIIQDPSSTLPIALIKKLRPLPMSSVMQTVKSLSDLLFRLGEHSEITRLPTAPTACALLILSLEAETRTSLPNAGELAERLAAFHHLAKGAVMSRYKLIQDVIADWINDVPWLDRYNSVNGRAKIAKRAIVAKGIKDVLQYRSELWNQELNSIRQHKHQLNNDLHGLDAGHTIPNSSGDGTRASETSQPPRKKRKTDSALDQASRFLLNPLAYPIRSPQSPNPIIPDHAAPENPDPQYLSPATPPIACLPMMSYLLSSAVSDVDIRKAPSRLQLLCAARGGEAGVRDEELLAEGEWEGLLRSEDEQRQLQNLWDRDAVFADRLEVAENVPQPVKKKRRTADEDGLQPGKMASGSQRINMEAFARFMASSDDEHEDLEFFDTPTVTNEDCSHGDGDGQEASDDPFFEQAPENFNASADDDVEVLASEWRPLSPTGGGAFEVGYEEHPS